MRKVSQLPMPFSNATPWRIRVHIACIIVNHGLGNIRAAVAIDNMQWPGANDASIDRNHTKRELI